LFADLLVAKRLKFAVYVFEGAGFRRNPEVGNRRLVQGGSGVSKTRLPLSGIPRRMAGTGKLPGFERGFDVKIFLSAVVRIGVLVGSALWIQEA
jgi:hypothetical protein